jgi:glutathione S-transferase
MALKLVIGNKNYSSWSLRPWIAMRHAGIAFEEEVVPLYEPGSRERILHYSQAGKVPVLRDGDLTIWDSLAILEYLAENYPDAALWPKDAAVRAYGRAIAAEMHSGFMALRRHCPMNMRRKNRKLALTADVENDVQRIAAIWREAQMRFGASGPFLLGGFSIADAMYAPIVSRFFSYGIAPGAEAQKYMATMMALPAWLEWQAASEAEPWVMPNNERD